MPGNVTACTPNRTTPATSAASVTSSVAAQMRVPATNALASRRRTRDTGRMSTYRRFPQLASLATESPANVPAMTISRNPLVALSTAAGTSKPLCDASRKSPSPPSRRGRSLRALIATTIRVGNPMRSRATTKRARPHGCLGELGSDQGDHDDAPTSPRC